MLSAARAKAEGCEVFAVAAEDSGVLTLLGGEAVGEGGDGDVVQLLSLELNLQEALGRCELRSEGGRTGFQLAKLLCLGPSRRIAGA